MNQKVCIVGLGYIGLPTASMFASHGYYTIGVDVNQEVVDALNKGKIIIEEPLLDELVKEVVDKNMLKGQVTPSKADIFIIAVPTPITKDKKADMSYVISATKSIVPYLRKGNIVVLESTSPVGTTKELIMPILQESGFEIGEDIYLGYSPERVLPGQILNELVNNSRVVGGINDISATKIKKVYEAFVKAKIYLTDSNTAEMCKLMENTYRDVNIALANELAKLSESMDINAWEVIEYCNKHPRVNIHNPGPGVGGHCLAVDPWFIVEKRPGLANLINLSRNINDSMPHHVFNHIEKEFIDFKNDSKKITILGITYKPNIDDMRESPITELIELLKESGYQVKVFDPYIKGLNKDLLNSCEGSDVVVLGVNHDAFLDINYKDILNVMRGNILIDTRNFLDKEKLEDIGFVYRLLGSSK